MKITLSKSQWEQMGKKAGWIKKADAQFDADIDAKLKKEHPLIHLFLHKMPNYGPALDIVGNIKNNNVSPENAGITSDVINQAKQIIQDKVRTASSMPSAFDNTIIIKEAFTLDARVIAAIICVILGIFMVGSVQNAVSKSKPLDINQRMEAALGK
jgi:hypothetical protein